MVQQSPGWQIGDVILDLYKVSENLGEGGFGKVYKVRHQGWNVDLAVKIPKPEIVAAAGGVENFEREAETWVNLGLHPHIVSCYYVRRIDNSPLVFAEYVAGGSLCDRIYSRQLYDGGTSISLNRIIDIAIQFAWGLHYAQEQGLIHQDVKPENVMVTPGGTVKVTDFGLANARTMAAILDKAAGENSTLVVEGSGAMTPAYCSPEQANRGTLTRRTDIWSWALCVLEMFQGERTWQFGSAATMALENYLQMGETDSQLPQMPNSVVNLLRRCFRENADERPRTMLEVANELKQIYQQVTGESYPRTEPNAAKDIADTLNNRAVSLLDLGKQEEALELWEKALKMQPYHPESTYNRGLVLCRSHKKQDIAFVKEMEQIRHEYPEDWKVSYLLAETYLEHGDSKAALQVLESIKENEAEQEQVQRLWRKARKQYSGNTFEGHINSVNSVSLSADGKFALSGSDDKTLKLWETATGRCLRTFDGHSDPVSSVSLSANGQIALSGSDKAVKLWDVAAGLCLYTFEEYKVTTVLVLLRLRRSVILSADGQFAVSFANLSQIKLWEVVTGRCLHTFNAYKQHRGLGGVSRSVSLSADSQYVLSGDGFPPVIAMWEVATDRCVAVFEGHTSSVNSVTLSADSQFALSGSDDKTLKLWEIATGFCLRTFGGHTDRVNSVTLSADSQIALSGSDDKTLKLWETSTGACLRTFEGHTDKVNSITLSADGQFALSASSDRTVKLWEVATGCCLRTFESYKSNYLAPLSLSRITTTDTLLSLRQELEKAQVALAKGDYVVAAQLLRKVRSQPEYSRNIEAFKAWADLYLCLPRKALIRAWGKVTFAKHKEVKSVSLSADGQLALSFSARGDGKLWEVTTGRCLRTFARHSSVLVSACLSADGKLALCGNEDSTLTLWEIATGSCLRTFRHTSSVNSVSLSADNRFAFSGSEDGTIKLWEIATGRCLRTFADDYAAVYSICLSANGQFLLSGSSSGSSDETLRLWEVATGRCLRTFTGHTSGVTSVCLSADSQLALSSSVDRTLKLWEVSTGFCLRTFEAQKYSMNSVSLTADGRFAWALDGQQHHQMENGTCDLWEIATGRCLNTSIFELDPLLFSSIFSADGQFGLYANHRAGTLSRWLLDWELEDRERADWDEGARPHLENFLTLHTPYAATLPQDREPTEEEITLSLTRRGTPTWTEKDFQNLLYTLGCAGYGWLRPEGVRQQLETMAATWQAPPLLGENAVVDKPPKPPETEFSDHENAISNSSQTTVQSSFTTQQQLMSAKVILTVTQGNLKGQKFEFDSRTTCIIGRAKDCHLQLPDDPDHAIISRYHCLLDINPPDIRIRDFGSLNGTYVNNQKIGQRQAEQTPEEAAQIKFPEYDLKNGDEIKLGNTVFQVALELNQETETLEMRPVPISTERIELLQNQQHLVLQINPTNPNLIAIEGYTTIRQLGKGGMGEVYLVRNQNTGEEVALKVMLPKVAVKPWAVEMFLREVENTKALNHPNIVQLKESGYCNGTFFFTLEYGNGGTLADLIRQRDGRLSVDEAIPIILQLLDALDYAHKAEIPCVKKADGTIAKGYGLVHRDLKPDNIFIFNNDNSRTVKIGDYGLAKAFDLAGLSGQTMTGTSAGTPGFMARQQVINFKYVNPEVDVWATAACLYNMLTGKFPRDFAGQDPFLVVLQTNAVPILQRNNSIPKPLAELIDLALVDHPQIHFKNARAFKQALLSVLN